MTVLTADQQASLARYEDLLRTRGAELGMISSADRERVRERHIEDSLRALDCVGPTDLHLVDLGSGAGLPGIPLAIALPDHRFTLIEARRGRGAFLELAVEALGLRNVRVVIEGADRVEIRADVCLARAFAPAPESWRAAERLLGPHGRLVYFAGASWDPRRDAELLRKQGLSVEICSPKRFTWQGPLVIMGRSSVSDGSHDHRTTNH